MVTSSVVIDRAVAKQEDITDLCDRNLAQAMPTAT
jgi:hypothetical protein